MLVDMCTAESSINHHQHSQTPPRQNYKRSMPHGHALRSVYTRRVSHGSSTIDHCRGTTVNTAPCKEGPLPGLVIQLRTVHANHSQFFGVPGGATHSPARRRRGVKRHASVRKHPFQEGEHVDVQQASQPHSKQIARQSPPVCPTGTL